MSSKACMASTPSAPHASLSVITHATWTAMVYSNLGESVGEPKPPGRPFRYSQKVLIPCTKSECTLARRSQYIVWHASSSTHVGGVRDGYRSYVGLCRFLVTVERRDFCLDVLRSRGQKMADSQSCVVNSQSQVHR